MRAWAADQSAQLTKELAGAWSEVTVTMMVDQGCVAPIYQGVRIRSAEGGLTIATFKTDTGKDIEGAAQPVKSFIREEFCAAVLKHYQAGVASEDFSEQINALPTQEERERAIALAFKAAGHPIGGFGALGIDIRIVREGQISHFDDNYGSTGWEAFQQWITEISPKTK
jgi:hypothetical protein